MKPRVLSLFAGYGGLTLAVEQHFDAELVAYSEFDEAPSKVMAHHWPGVPNLGDITSIDWEAVNRDIGPIHIVDGGSPCQDLSAAGRRAGMTEGTRSNLWANMREAIAILKPRYVVWENVRGAYSATAISDADREMEHGTRLLGGGEHRPALRALGRVLGDLSDLGFDAEWRGVRASDVGAPHQRFRVFVLATRRATAHPGHDTGRYDAAANADDGQHDIGTGENWAL